LTAEFYLVVHLSEKRERILKVCTMSGQWEVVGKSKQKQSKQSTKKLSKSEKKKFVENAPKVEDIRKLFRRLLCIPYR